jgi:NodT family efflux transporter outer membrane factor (OMF) lipoprotein
MRRAYSVCLLLAPALAATLAGCALGPKTVKPDLRLPAAYEAPPETPTDAAQLDRWWNSYGDPQLTALIDEALARAPDARSAMAKLHEAKAVRSSAVNAFLPQGNLQGSATRTDTTPLKGGSFQIVPGGPSVSLVNAGFANAYSGNFNVTWEIDLFGRSFVTRSKADADLNAAKFDYAATRTSLAANVADSLFQARGLAIQLEDARETARLQKDLSRVAHAKADHGLGALSDAQQVDSQTAQAEAEAADLEGQLHAARRSLLVLVGRGADPLASLPAEAVAATPPAIPATVPAALLARRPDVREAAQKLRSAAGQMKLDELALFPKFTLQPGSGISSAESFGSQITTDFWSIGLGVAQPILDLPRLRAEIRAQGARVDQAAIAYEKAVQTAYGESENALVQLAADEERIKILSAGEAEGRSAYDAARKRYSLGIDDLTSVLSAERTWRTARTALTSAQVQALRRSVQAYKALGGGWTPPPMKPGRAGGGL